MQNNPTIQLDRIYFKDNHQIKIIFPYNDNLLKVIREIPEAKWSKTLSCWYILNTPENLKLIFNKFKNITKIDSKLLFKKTDVKDFPKKRIRNLTAKNRATLNQFFKYLRGKRYSKSTIDVYTQLVADFVEYYNDKNLALLNNKDVERFIEDIYIKKNYSISTQRQFISGLKLFIVFIEDININNLELVRPKKSKKLPTVLSYQELIRLLQVTKNIKHRTILALLYSSGLRISEVLNLKINHIEFSRKQIFVNNGKGRKDRYVTLAESVIPLIENYLVTYTPKLYFFEGEQGQQYSDSSVRKFLKKSCQLAHITSNVSPHTLRHSYATHLLEQGVGIRHIQELLGHAKPETTMIYTHVARKDLLSIKSPLDNAIAQLKKLNSATNVPNIPNKFTG